MEYCFGASNSLVPFARLIQADRLPQALILTGRAGLGKKAYARALASLSFCETTSACGSCGPCLQIAAGQHPHVFVEDQCDDAKSVASIMQLQEHLATKGGRSERSPYGRRIAIIGDAEELSLAAANRLLKTLEEPPAQTCIILTSSRPQALLPTILSRCVKWRMVSPLLSELMVYLRQRQRTSGEGWPDLSASQLESLCKRHGCCPGEVVSALEAGREGMDDQRLVLQELLSSGQFTAMLEMLDRIKQEKSLSASEIAACAEYALNSSYRNYFLGPDDADTQELHLSSPLLITRRRHLLRTIKDLATKQHIALNAPLAAEALFYQGFMREQG